MSIIVDMIAKSAMNSNNGELPGYATSENIIPGASDLKTVHWSVKLEVNKCATLKKSSRRNQGHHMLLFNAVITQFQSLKRKVP